MDEVVSIVLEEGTSRKDPEKEFQLLEKLGEGSYGSVWKAIHKQTGSVVAVKRVSIDNDLEDIVKEIEFMKGCSSPYIVRYYGSYFKDSELWIVMEYCGAGSICDIMKICDKTLTEEQIAVVCKDVLHGLFYLHGVRKIHRDIKAGNILLNMNGASKLADFGVSGQLSDTMAKRQTVIGTPFWMAPEVIQEVGYDFKADLWSLGITCIELAESKPPYSNIHPMRAIFMIPSRPPPKLTEPEKWSPVFEDFLAKCLIKNPDQRPSSKELLEHAFIVGAKSRALLQPLLDHQEQIISRVGRDAALGIDAKEEDEDSDDDDEDSENTGTVRRGGTAARGSDEEDTRDSGTVVISSGNRGSANFGTMVVNDEDDDGSSTMKRVSSQKKYVPPFMDHIRKQQQQQSKSPSVPAGNPKFANCSLEELKKMVEDLDLQREKEIENIRERYNINKRSILAAIDERSLAPSK